MSFYFVCKIGAILVQLQGYAKMVLTTLSVQIVAFFVSSFIVRTEGNATWSGPGIMDAETNNWTHTTNWMGDPNEKLRRNYNLQDFLWAASGDGPAPSEDDGGLAWEDNGGGAGAEGHEVVVQITTTKTLFKTVLSTVYPVEYTPTLMLSSVTPTGRLVESLRSPYYSPHYPPATPIFATPAYVTPSASVPPWSPDAGGGDSGSPFPPTEVPDVDRLYWVQTVIKANRSLIETQPEFQCLMQKNLARVYASAFKRHLLHSLGVLEEKNRNKEETRRRRRRGTSSRTKRSTLNYLLNHREDIDSEWLYSNDQLTANRLRTLATTAMNVTVTILNISQADSVPQNVIISYVVFAEGNPVLASSAVQDLSLVSRQEMEREIGYEVINKAEALVASPLRDTKYVEEATSPWLIVAVTTIILMILLIVILIYMVWKWKHNRLGDTIMHPARPQSGIEEGVVNPAFLGPPSPIERSEVLRDLPPAARSSSRTVSVRTSFKSVQEFHQKRYSSSDQGRQQQRAHQEALASELNALLTAAQVEKLSPSSVGSATESSKKGRKVVRERLSDKSSGSDEGTQVIQPKRPSTSSKSSRQQPPHRRSGSSEKEEKKRREKVIREDSGGTSAVISSETVEVVKRRKSKEKMEQEKATSFPGRVRVSSLDEHLPEGIGRSMDRISFGNLDVSQDSLARPISAKARKLLPKNVSSSYSFDVKTLPKKPARARGSEDEDESGKKRSEGTSGDKQGSEDRVDVDSRSVFEQDRDIGESVENIQSTIAEPATKDAEVQTPTRRPKPKAKPRKRVNQLSSESLVSTESEETVYVHEFDSSPGELNPMGRMRKRFHQFLDDAFNIMGKREETPGEDPARSKSARVSISHLVETREKSRPWTSQTVREESLHCGRPKSASFGPKPAWDAAKSPRRCQSAKSRGASAKEHRDRKSSATILEGAEENEGPEESDITSTPISSSQMIAKDSRQQRSVEPVFPQYPIYPDIPVGWSAPEPKPVVVATTAKGSVDPAVPLILAIKEEIKRFEKVKATDEGG